MTKTQAISQMIVAKIEEGMNPIEAAKAILGADKIDTMITELYNELRGQAA